MHPKTNTRPYTSERIRRRQAQQAAARRRQILETAGALFHAMGHQKTAVADIARELGMSPANIYRYFASKSAINEAIAGRVLEAVAGDLGAALEAALTDRDKCLAAHGAVRGRVVEVASGHLTPPT